MARGRPRPSKSFKNLARQRFYTRASPPLTDCKRPGRCSTNSKNGVPSCLRSGTKKLSLPNGAWSRARKTRSCPPTRFASSKTNLFPKSCNVTTTKPLATTGIEPLLLRVVSLFLFQPQLRRPRTTLHHLEIALHPFGTELVWMWTFAASGEHSVFVDRIVELRVVRKKDRGTGSGGLCGHVLL